MTRKKTQMVKIRYPPKLDVMKSMILINVLLAHKVGVLCFSPILMIEKLSLNYNKLESKINCQMNPFSTSLSSGVIFIMKNGSQFIETIESN